MMNENSAAIRLILREESDSIERKERLLLLSALLCAEAGLVHMLSAALPGAGVSAAAALALLFALSAALLLLAKGNRTLLFGCGALLMAGLFTLPLFRSGLLALVNGFRSALCACTGCIILPLEGADEGRSAYALWVLLAYFALLLCASVLGSGRLGAALSLLPFLLFWAVGFVPVDGGAALYLFGVGTLLLRGRGGRNAVAALLCLLLCLSAAFGLQVQSGLPDSLRIALHALRYDSETNAMPEGDLSTLGSFRKSDTPALTVTMETPQKLYLRGFTGESYTGQSWEPLTNAEKAPWSESFYALHESGYYALSAIGTAAEVTDSLRPAEISVTNESACSARLYLPYGLMGNGLLDASAIGDSTAPPGKSWSGKMSSGSVPDWFTLRASLSVMSSDPGVSAYLRREQLYRSFAESEYLRVPEETAAVLAEAIDLPEGGYTLSEIKDCILTVLKDRMCYDESESLRLGEQDFAACVLENEMAGYSVHYATLAALMLRTLGVPARYVEGYYLSAEEAAQYTGGEPVTLTENHAHAWAEYYLDGVGWIPFETTPPYIDEEELNAGPGTGEERNVGEAVTVAPADENAYPTGKWTLENLDISQTDALEIKVISYVDGTTRTYSIALEKREPTTVTAYVNMSAAGKLVTDKNGKTMARIPVMLNTKESYTINDLLKKFHEQHHPDGAAAYAVVNDPDYGPSVSKLWGDASGNFGYQLNGASVAVWGPSDTIRNGDTLDVTLYANSYPDTESYTAFSAYTLSTNSITPVTLTLNGGSYDDNWALVMAPLAGATLTVDGVATEAVTDANGQATLTIAAPGTHIVSAEMSKTVGEAEVTAITAPVCIVTVTYATAVVPEVSEGKASATVSEDIEIPEDEPLTISAVAGAEATETAVTIPAALAEKLDNASSLELTTNAGTITFDNAALSQMTGGKAVEISMAAEPQQNGDIVLELTAKADGENVFAENGSGTATVAIPVEAPGEGEELHVYYNDGETLTRIPAHYENGKLVVTLTHFSEYVIKTEEPDTGFTVTADSTVAATIGEDVAITLSIAAPNEKFNAYHFVLGYDSAKLEYKSFSIEGAEVVNKDGTLTIAGYGADKTANPVITFTTKAVGTSTVSLTTARLDEAANANTKDAPDATVINGSTKVTANAYTVSLPAGFSGEKTVQPGASYTFTANDKNYSYELSATVGGTPVEITDNKDGSFTIANVSGALVITEVSRTGKSVSVSVDQSGTGKDDVTADATATYGTDYGFTVTKADNYSYTVSMTINGAGYTAFTVSGNDYTIPGNALTGNVVIKVDKTYSGATDTRTVTVTGTGKDDVTAAATATQGTNFSFTLTKAAGYEYSVTVTIGSAVYEPAVSDNQYTIAGAALTGDVTISVTKTVIITVSVSKYLELNAKTMYLVVATSATLPEGETLAYGETTMFSSEKYQGYAYLVISEESADTVKAAAEEAIKQVTATSTAVDYSGDVNGTGLVDINDAQLTYNIYNVRYESFEALAMARFLAADVNGDKEVNVTDAAAIVSTVLGK